MGMNREQWLEARRNSIGASEVAAVLGLDEYRGPIAVWHDKVAGAQELDLDHLEFGRTVEDGIAGLYHRRTKREVIPLDPHEIVYHPDFPWLGATLDRKTVLGEKTGALELKHVGGRKIRQHEWGFNPPDNYQMQLQMQLACTGLDWGCLAGMFMGYQLEIFDTDARPEFFEAAIPHLEEFWKCVVHRETPKADATPASTAVIKKMYPRDSGETIHLSDAKTLERLEERLRLKSSIKEEEKLIKEIENEIKLAMGEATYAVLADGTKITSRRVEVSERTQKVRGYSYRTFSIKRSKRG